MSLYCSLSIDLDNLLWTGIGMEKRKHQLLTEESSKDARVKKRLPAELLEQVKAAAARRGMPYYRFIHQALYR